MKIYLQRERLMLDRTLGTLTVEQMNNVQSFSCKTLEPTRRELKVINGYLVGKKYGMTAIPEGEYTIEMMPSHKFGGQLMPYLIDIIGFRGVMLHPGNYPDDTLGCILVGDHIEGIRNPHLVKSKEVFNKLQSIISEAWRRGEPIRIKVSLKDGATINNEI